MSDLSKLSDDELRALYARQAQAQRAVSQMSDDELRAAAYVQPQPPPGVTINTATGPVYSQGDGKFVATTPAEAQARALRERDGISGDVADSVLRGVPFAGPFMPRARAGVQALIGNGDYAQNLEAEQARANTYDADYPIASTAGKVGGAIAGTVAGSAMLPNAAGFALGTGASTLPGAVLRGATAGLTQGVAQGVGDTRDITNTGEVIRDAGKTGLIGLGLGAFIPAAVGGAGMVLDKVRNVGGDALSNVSGKARKYLSEMIDPATAAQQNAAARALGPNGMLADVAEEWKGIAQGASARPASRGSVVDALKARDAGKNARLQGTIDTELGPAPTPSWQDARIKENQRALGPVYERAVAGQPSIDVNVGLLQKVDDALLKAKGDEAAALNEVRKTLLMQNGQPDISAEGLHGTRKALDLLLERYQQTPGMQRVVMPYRQAVDDALKTNVKPFGRLDAAYSEMANQREMLEKGATVFDTGKTAIRPEELNSVVNANRPASNRMLSAGARAEIDRIVGNNANDVAKLNSLLKGEGDWNRDKLRLLFGQEKADRVLKVLDAERVMEETKRAVVDGSQTAPRMGFAKFLDEVAGSKTPTPGDTLFGTGKAVVQNLIQKVTKANSAAEADKLAGELGKLSVATGADRDAIVQALLDRGARKSTLQKFYQAGGGSVSPVSQALLGAYDNR